MSIKFICPLCNLEEENCDCADKIKRDKLKIELLKNIRPNYNDCLVKTFHYKSLTTFGERIEEFIGTHDIINIKMIPDIGNYIAIIFYRNI